MVSLEIMSMWGKEGAEQSHIEETILSYHFHLTDYKF